MHVIVFAVISRHQSQWFSKRISSEHERYVSLVEQNMKFYLNKNRIQSVYDKIGIKPLCAFMKKKSL